MIDRECSCIHDTSYAYLYTLYHNEDSIYQCLNVHPYSAEYFKYQTKELYKSYECQLIDRDHPLHYEHFNADNCIDYTANYNIYMNRYNELYNYLQRHNRLNQQKATKEEDDDDDDDIFEDETEVSSNVDSKTTPAAPAPPKKNSNLNALIQQVIPSEFQAGLSLVQTAIITDVGYVMIFTNPLGGVYIVNAKYFVLCPTIPLVLRRPFISPIHCLLFPSIISKIFSISTKICFCTQKDSSHANFFLVFDHMEERYYR